MAPETVPANDSPDPTSRPPRAKSWRFVLLLIVLTLACFLLGRWANLFWQRRAYAAQQQAIADQLRALDATVYYDYQCPASGDSGRRSVTGASQELLDDDQTPYWPLAYGILGRDFLHDVVYINCTAHTRVGTDTQVPVSRPDINDQLLTRLLVLRQLRWLGLSGGQVTDRGLETISQLPHIEQLWLAGTPITDQGMVHIGRMPHLQRLYIDRTAISDAGLQPLGQLTQLRTLLLPAGPISDRGVAHLRSLVNLQELYLSGTRVRDEGLRALSRLRQLELFSLRDTRVTDDGLAHLAGLRQLRALALDGTRISDDGLAHLQELENLAVLVLDGTRVSDAGLSQLGKLTNLQTLRISRTACTLRGAAHLLVDQQGRSLDDALTMVVSVQRQNASRDDTGSEMAGHQQVDDQQATKGPITSLDPLGVRVTDDCLSVIAQLTELQWLKLAGTEVTGAGLQQLSGLAQLTLLDLSHTSVSNEGLESVIRLPKLRTLHLADTPVDLAALDARLQVIGSRLRVQTVDLSQLGPISRPQGGDLPFDLKEGRPSS